MEDFVDWLTEELRQRKWPRTEAARRGGISASMFDKVIRREANPGLDFCIGVARAFSIPREEVFRRAGILPQKIEDDEIVEKIMYYLERLSEADRKRAIGILEVLVNESNSEAQAAEHAGQLPDPVTS